MDKHEDDISSTSLWLQALVRASPSSSDASIQFLSTFLMVVKLCSIDILSIHNDGHQLEQLKNEKVDSQKLLTSQKKQIVDEYLARKTKMFGVSCRFNNIILLWQKQLKKTDV